MKQCRECGVIFSPIANENICADCHEKDRELFKKVNDFIPYGQSLKPEELAERSGVKLDKILSWINEGKFG